MKPIRPPTEDESQELIVLGAYQTMDEWSITPSNKKKQVVNNNNNNNRTIDVAEFKVPE